jgi:SAM-dependent methyltransferase
MSQTGTAPAINEEKLNEFMGKALGDFGASMSATLVYVGDKLGLYAALAADGPATPAELAQRTNTVERYVLEWLINQAAGGYVEYDSASGKYSLTPEQATALADPDSPFSVIGMFYGAKALNRAAERIEDSFRHGGGMLWGEHDPDLFVGTERLFRPGYKMNLVDNWIPALTGVKEKLEKGARVADVGCGYGASTIIMAQAYPHSRFWGFDVHEPSIERARQNAQEAGVSDRVNFAVATAQNFPGSDYDLVAFFDCLHDMGDPEGASRRAHEALASDGTALIVEPMGGHTAEENFNPIGRAFAAASTLCCTPNSLAQGGKGLGAIAPEQNLREAVMAGGFAEFRRATETPFNRIFEARR